MTIEKGSGKKKHEDIDRAPTQIRLHESSAPATMVAAVPDEDGLISGLSEDQLVTVDEIDTLIKEVRVAPTNPPSPSPNTVTTTTT
tara:strand:+ start:172 stop:429 length:258 start_codon:yes stop_codon:yes gene_type:complete